MASFNDMQAKTNVEWKNSDVHAWSESIRTTINQEFPMLIQDINYTSNTYNYVRDQLLNYLFPNDHRIAQIVHLIDQRCGYSDSALLEVKCEGCLCMAYFLVKRHHFESSIVCLFYDTLMDMGQTCLQGYTHRLISFIIAILRSMSKNKNEN